jgi:hypothetical protein
MVPELVGNHVAQPSRRASPARPAQIDDSNNRLGLRHEGDRARLAIDERHFAEDFAAAKNAEFVTGRQALKRRESFLRQGHLPFHNNIDFAGVFRAFLKNHAAGLEPLVLYMRKNKSYLLSR